MALPGMSRTIASRSAPAAIGYAIALCEIVSSKSRGSFPSDPVDVGSSGIRRGLPMGRPGLSFQ